MTDTDRAWRAHATVQAADYEQQGVREAIREDSGPREESIALPFAVEKLIDKAEADLAARDAGAVCNDCGGTGAVCCGRPGDECCGMPEQCTCAAITPQREGEG